MRSISHQTHKEIDRLFFLYTWDLRKIFSSRSDNFGLQERGAPKQEVWDHLN